MKVITALNSFKEVRDFNIIWEKFCACLFNYTFALGVDSEDTNEMTLFIVYGMDGKDQYKALDTYFLPDYQGNSNLLLEYIKGAMVTYLKSALTARIYHRLLTVEEIEKMVKN